MCGIAGIVGHSAVNQQLYDALTVLQHRGQDAAGIVTDDRGVFKQRKANGLVRDVFRNEHMERLSGNVGIGHVRYPTAGSNSSALAQPFYVNSPYGICLAHNGNLTNSVELREQVFQSGLRHINTDSDSEVLLNVFAHELQLLGKLAPDAQDIFTAVSGVHRRARGAYAALVLIAGHGVVGFRDPCGIRPLIFGERESAQGREYMIASESVALDVLGFRVIRDVAPGEAVHIDTHGRLHTRQCAQNPRLSPCIFEHVYFARPDSIMDGISVYKARLRQGERLAEKIRRLRPDHDIDVVIPVPDTSRVAAQVIAYELDVKFREGLMKNRYIGRTFIAPSQEMRALGVRMKLNPLRENLTGKRVVVVDDSVVRGTTQKQLVKMLREAGVAEVHLRLTSPPIKWSCFYGIDTGRRSELLAANLTVEEIRDYLDVDTLAFITLDRLVASTGAPGAGFCAACFTGEYPVPVPVSLSKGVLEATPEAPSGIGAPVTSGLFAPAMLPADDARQGG